MLLEQFGDEVGDLLGIDLDGKEDGEISENEEKNLETEKSVKTEEKSVEIQNSDDDIEVLNAPEKPIDLICLDPE